MWQAADKYAGGFTVVRNHNSHFYYQCIRYPQLAVIKGYCNCSDPNQMKWRTNEWFFHVVDLVFEMFCIAVLLSHQNNNYFQKRPQFQKHEKHKKNNFYQQGYSYIHFYWMQVQSITVPWREEYTMHCPCCQNMKLLQMKVWRDWNVRVINKSLC